MSEQRLDSRTFCGRFPWPLVADLADGDEIAACFVVREARKLQTKTNQPYLRLLLGDKTGTIEAVIWDDIDRFEPICAPNSVVGVRGRVSLYQERPQLKILTVEAVHAGPADMELLVPASHRDRDLMEKELDAWIASVKDRGLRGLLRRCLGRDTDLGRAFRVRAAATRNHHAYLSGLLEHSLSVAGACEALAEHYRQQGRHLDRDLLVAGALLHDLGKVVELDALPAASYTTPGRLLGHIVLGIQLVALEGAKVPELDDEKLLLLQHLIASHQGKPEWDSPRVPQTIEAILLHYADDLDAKLNQATAALNDVEPGTWSTFDRSLGRFLYLPTDLAEKQRSRNGLPDEAVIDLFRD